MLLLWSGCGVVSFPPAFEVNFDLATVYQDDVGLHLISDDLGWKISHAATRKNLQSNDLGLKISQHSIRWNIRKDD